MTTAEVVDDQLVPPTPNAKPAKQQVRPADGGPVVLSASHWPTNADLIVDVHRLGYLHVDAPTLDPTFGKGVWWKKWRPHNLVTHDLKLDGVDFRKLPEKSSTFAQIAYDPPYVAVGGRDTSGMKDFQEGYGLDEAPTTPAELQQMINDGLAEMVRVLKPSGVLLVKCQDYVTSGNLWLGTHHTLTAALELELTMQDRFEHIDDNPRPQPERSRADGKPVVQQHSRRNLSTLFVFTKASARQIAAKQRRVARDAQMTFA